MTERSIHNLKSIVTQLILLALCVYGVQLIRVQIKVKNIKENILTYNSLNLNDNEYLPLPTTEDKLLLKFEKINNIEKQSSQLIQKEIDQVKLMNTQYQAKIDSLSKILNRLKLNQNDEVLKEQDVFKRNQALASKYNQYYQIISSFKSNNINNPLWGSTEQDIDAKIDKMTISELVGQLFIIGLDSDRISQEEEKGIQNFNPSGIILMGKNIIDQEQTKTITNILQSTNPRIPLYISTDQEGGVVKRVNWDTVPAQNSWLNTPKDKLCEYGKQRGEILTQIGVNLNFAPVVDLGNNDAAFINTRTISTDPAIVSQKVLDYRACAENKVMSTLKHFPGHGMVTGDSHLIIPSNPNITKEDWLKTHAKPFIDNINSPFIMTSHITINNIDNKPASMSSIWINDILKKELGYKGLVITDEMFQYFNISNLDMNESALNAILAGNDQILYTANYNQVLPIKDYLTNYFKDKKLDLNQIVKKILIAKTQLL